MAAVSAQVPGTNNKMVRNLPEGADLTAELAKMQADYPGYVCEIIGTQSFGMGEGFAVGERDEMPGY